MTYTEVEQKIFNWASCNSSIPVIYADQNAPRPNEAYITLRINTFTMIGQAYYDEPDTNGDRIIKYDEDLVVSLQSFGIGTQNNLQELKDSLQKSSVIQDLEAAELAVRMESIIQDISELIDETIEKRFIYEITFSFAKEICENAGLIEDVEYSGTYIQPQ